MVFGSNHTHIEREREIEETSDLFVYVLHFPSTKPNLRDQPMLLREKLRRVSPLVLIPKQKKPMLLHFDTHFCYTARSLFSAGLSPPLTISLSLSVNCIASFLSLRLASTIFINRNRQINNPLPVLPPIYKTQSKRRHIENQRMPSKSKRRQRN